MTVACSATAAQPRSRGWREEDVLQVPLETNEEKYALTSSFFSRASTVSLFGAALTMRHLVQDTPQAPYVASPTELHHGLLSPCGGIDGPLSRVLKRLRAHVVERPELRTRKQKTSSVDKSPLLIAVYIIFGAIRCRADDVVDSQQLSILYSSNSSRTNLHASVASSHRDCAAGSG